MSEYQVVRLFQGKLTCREMHIPLSVLQSLTSDMEELSRTTREYSVKRKECVTSSSKPSLNHIARVQKRARHEITSSEKYTEYLEKVCKQVCISDSLFDFTV